MDTKLKQIVINKYNAISIIKQYLTLSYNRGIFNSKDVSIINTSLTRINRKLSSNTINKLVICCYYDFFIVKKYIIIAYKGGVFSQQDIKIINITLTFISKLLKVKTYPPLDTIIE